ncbi:unnamed protein product [Vicia faba]|uniref:Uncharacterized protein n=1 Tax=Vicia faba TaxID=3906 RepID=A0AAV1B3U5_VICFA|nr:unnamed protein product [Vicia faba]
MDLQGKNFGRGSRELGGGNDLVSQYKLWPFYNFFCKRSVPLSETHYLRNVVGDTQIKKGEGMELDQLCKNTYMMSEKKPCLSPFDFNVLSEAFRLKQTDPNHISSVRKVLPNVVANPAHQSRETERKNKKDNKYRKHKLLQIKNGSCVANNTIIHNDSHPLQLKNQQDKKRRAEASYDPSTIKRLNSRQ